MESIKKCPYCKHNNFTVDESRIHEGEINKNGTLQLTAIKENFSTINQIWCNNCHKTVDGTKFNKINFC